MLPKDSIKIIFDHLDLEDIKNVSETSSPMEDLSREHRSNLSKLTVKSILTQEQLKIFNNSK